MLKNKAYLNKKMKANLEFIADKKILKINNKKIKLDDSVKKDSELLMIC